MKCPNCNAYMETFDRFCENCGAFVAEGEAIFSVNHASQDAAPASGAAPAPATNAEPTASAAASSSPVSTPYAQATSDYQTPTPGQSPYAQAEYSQPVHGQHAYEQAPGYAPGPLPTMPYMAANTAPATALVLSIVSLVLGCTGFITFGVFGFLGVVGLVLAIVALVQRSGYAKKGLNDPRSTSTTILAVIGIITNALALLIFSVMLAITIDIATTEDPDSIPYHEPAVEEIISGIDT